MRRFNQIRKTFKHKGLLVSQSEIDTVKSNIHSFFKENTSHVFGITFDSLSLIEFEAQEDIKNLKSTEAVNKISVSFDYLINDYLLEIFGYDNNPIGHLKKEEEKVDYFDINYSAYQKFRKLVNQPFRVNGSEFGIPSNTKQYTQENQFCLNFTVESTMKIQKYLHTNIYE